MRLLRVGVWLGTALAAVGLALVGGAACPPMGFWPLVLLSISLFLLLLQNRAPVEALSLGLLYGLVYGLGTMYWFFGISGPLAVPLIALMGAYFGPLGTLIGLSRGHSPLARAALVALFDVAVEWLRGDAWYLRFPWYTALHVLAQSPAWVAAARWLGVYGLSYLVWLIAGLGAFGRLRNWLAFLLLPLFWLLLPAPAAPDRRALLVQTEGPTQLEAFVPAIPAEDVDLVVLPEYAYFSSPQSAEIAAEAERNAYIARACGDDAELRAHVEKLVQAHFRAGNFLEEPAGKARPPAWANFPFPEPPVAGSGEEHPGTDIGPYKLLEQIGKGGFGVVFVAEQQQPVRRRVALKVLKPGMD
jgi:apolipoprotein N-acyltransferase